MAKLETMYKRQLSKLLGVWSESYEPGRGSCVGYPDLQVLVNGVLVPIEVKCGEVQGEVLMPSAIRPSQIAWHHDFFCAGGKAFVVVCAGPVSSMDAWALPSVIRDALAMWSLGWVAADCQQWVRSGRLVRTVNELVGIK